MAFAGLWVISPIDLIPELLPVIGPLDDIVVVTLTLRYAAGTIPGEATREAGRPNNISWIAYSAIGSGDRCFAALYG